MGYEAYTNARDLELRNGERQRAEMDTAMAQRTRRQAGNALAGGDYAGASNALLQGGDLEAGLSVQNAGRTRQTADREQQRTAILAMVTGLRQAPAEQRPALIQQIGPRLSVYGVTPDQLGTITPEDLSDRGLDALIQTMGGEVQQPRLLQGYRGALDEIDPYSREVRSIRGPQQAEPPTGYRWKDDGTLELIPGYVQGQDAVSDARRASPRPRASGGRGGGGSGPRPPATPARRPWENF